MTTPNDPAINSAAADARLIREIFRRVAEEEPEAGWFAGYADHPAAPTVLLLLAGALRAVADHAAALQLSLSGAGLTYDDFPVSDADIDAWRRALLRQITEQACAGRVATLLGEPGDDLIPGAAFYTGRPQENR